MVEKGPILLYGKKDAKYHPMEPVEKVLSECYDTVKVVATENKNHLAYLNVSQYYMVILYEEFGEEPVNSIQGAGILQYVAGGGKLLVIHNGISVQENAELAQLIGGKFTGHPPYTTLPILEYHIEKREQPYMKCMKDFSLPEEIYQFDMDNFAKCEILCSFRVKGQEDDRIYPAIWARNYGMGKVIYCAPGHRSENLQSPQIQQFLKNVYEA
ncbi:MAG: ThuA domain-containing protein [Lachnospiraceae bacterium]|nr:ThuA domain-containing protein [Lachnospiraceae bacterium]